MSEEGPEVLLLERRIDPADLRRLAAKFEKMALDPALRAKVREITHALVGEGEPL